MNHKINKTFVKCCRGDLLTQLFAVSEHLHKTFSENIIKVSCSVIQLTLYEYVVIFDITELCIAIQVGCAYNRN